MYVEEEGEEEEEGEGEEQERTGERTGVEPTCRVCVLWCAVYAVGIVQRDVSLSTVQVCGAVCIAACLL